MVRLSWSSQTASDPARSARALHPISFPITAIVNPSTTRAMYAAKPSPATFASITGGYHCGFLDSSPLFGIGCDRGAISRSTQLAVTKTLLGDWFDQTLKGLPATSTPSGVVTGTK